MTDLYRVRIDIGQMMVNTLTGEGEEPTEAYVRDWLSQIGFVHEPCGADAWVGPEVGLRCLDQSEVISAEPVN